MLRIKVPATFLSLKMVEVHVSAVIIFSRPLHNYVCQGSAVAGQNTTYIPHKGVLSPKEHVLYVSYSNGAGPYDGTLGSVYKYNISSSTCKCSLRSDNQCVNSLKRDGYNACLRVRFVFRVWWS